MFVLCLLVAPLLAAAIKRTNNTNKVRPNWLLSSPSKLDVYASNRDKHLLSIIYIGKDIVQI
jgi:hypothetical protein